jgi:hypothetical protein
MASSLPGEIGIVRTLEGTEAVRLHTSCAAQIRCTDRSEIPATFGARKFLVAIVQRLSKSHLAAIYGAPTAK